MIRRRSFTSRLVDTLPVVLVLGIALGGVFVAMNILVVAAPVAILESPSPSVSVGPSFASSPSLLPSATPLVSASPFATASLSDARPVLIRSAVTATDPGGIWTVYLEYPTFQRGTTPWADVMNSDLANEMQTRATQWEEGPASIRQVPGKRNVLSGAYRTELLTGDLASFTITWIDDASASAPANEVETVNFDLATGQRIDFDSMFGDVPLALANISASAESQLVGILGRNFDSGVVADGTSPSRSNFVNWALTTAGLRVTFAEHQVDSGAGLFVVTVPWSALRDAMTTSGPVAALAGTQGP